MARQEAFSARLIEAMARTGMKQADVIHAASKYGGRLGKSQVSQYVSGKTVPRRNVMALLAQVLGVREVWLADGMGPMVDEGHSANDANSVTRGAWWASASGPTKMDDDNEAPASADDVTRASARPAAASNSFTSNPKRSASMREFKKSTKLDNVLYDVRGPVADEAARMESEGLRILKLNIGNPAPFGFRTPDEVVTDMRQQLPDCEGYSDSRGLFSARKAIMQYAQIKNLPNVGMEDIYTGNGVSELIQLTMNALLDNGDEILIPSPDYPLWTACATLAGGVPVHYVCDEQTEWCPDIADMEAKVTERTKAIVIINPNNPTGAVYPREILEQIVEIARRHQLMILSDEIYDRLCMDGYEHISVASLAPDLPCVTFSGLSKSHMIAGYRIGWMVLSGDKRCMRDFIYGINMLSNMRLCSNVPAQSIVQTALGGHQSVTSYIVPGGRVYEQRNYVYEALNAIDGITAVKPKAAFYIFPKMDVKKFNITDDEQFALDLLHQKRILITRGGGFNWDKPDHFRIVYLPRMEVLREAMTDLADFFEHYRQH
ncbi:MAG TPA: aminotransferase class I/II-fold pyridoxal phosphate-dependent enzyme [Enorma massiliensis]|uniref:aminotransferase class I/II-fold pyridoxal phosphate-dependent enzyme n=1 Tax=Enorma massiliensis TaxID=1472761 RepID=UPI001DB3E873|nr:aminotransferase class I/II-fold pyridoxal phosphate-dependent enzyme [Enorma massiliensis]HJG61778.1 aminotransferase class I/II-fold pyridoxal phosphate-dependent enzyme [Enorma massiliensis]